MKVLKFGGSSVGNAERIEKVYEIIKNYNEQKVEVSVVFSAFQGVTDKLIDLGHKAVQRDLSYKETLIELKERHLKILNELNSNAHDKILLQIEEFFTELENVLQGIYLIRELSKRSLDYILSFGELLSCTIIHYTFLNRDLDFDLLDARAIIKTDEQFGSAKVNFEQTNKNILDSFRNGKQKIITGFISSTDESITTTLGRGGSDYTASIFGAALDVEEIEIWTDVNGILTADPNNVKGVFSLKAVTYEEAMELSHFGAKVIHPPTMIPALNKKIKIRIRNTFEPSFKGTLILERQEDVKFNAKGISSIDRIALIKVTGSGMIGVAGIASRLLSSLARKNISVILITQGSSEHSICLAVLPEYGLKAQNAIKEEFKYEIKDNIINRVTLEDDLSVIAVVGDDLVNTAGIFGKAFQSLGHNGINVNAVAQGSSQLNMSIVVKRYDLKKALNVLHDSLFLSKVKTINLFMAGPGLVGSAFLNLLSNRLKYINKELKTDFRLIGLCNSKRMIYDEDGIEIENCLTTLKNSDKKSDVEKFIKSIKDFNLPNAVFIDCTAGKLFIPNYESLLKNNVSVVTPNKIANTNSYDEFLKLKKAAKDYDVSFRYSTNVGAALPIINTLKDLIANGDKIVKIEGVLSGTLSFIFNSLKDGKTFSECVKTAKELGYTEPDPRDDLNGLDFARKLLILLRESGHKYELNDIEIENLVPEKAQNVKTTEEFFQILESEDKVIQERVGKAKEEGRVLCYIARYDDSGAKVGIEEIGESHPFYNLSGNDNIVAFTTKNYSEKPLIIRGAGAGADFTATGVFADLLRISN